MSEFIVCPPHLVGNVHRHEVVCSSDGVRLSSSDLARAHGIETLDHDDFWIAEVNGRELVAIRHSNGEVRSEATVTEMHAVREAIV